MKTAVLVSSFIAIAALITGVAVVCIADSERSSDSESSRREAEPIPFEATTSPRYDLPRPVAGTVKFQDVESLDERVAFRTATLALEDGIPIQIGSAYRKYFDDDDDLKRKISVLADLNAAFGETYNALLHGRSKDMHIRLHVGEFSQDYCGPITVVYSIETTHVISAVVGDPEIEHQLLHDTKCELENTSNSPTFCENRDLCLRDHLSQKNYLDISSKVLRGLIALRIE